MQEYDRVNMKTLQSEARMYGIQFKAGMKKEDLYDLIQEAKNNDELLKKAREADTVNVDESTLDEAERLWRDNMKLKRISLSSNVPTDIDVSGVQVSVKISNKKLQDKPVSVSRFIPFDTVWMVEQCILDSLSEDIFYKRKKFTKKNTAFGDDFGYRQIPAKKYNIEILDDMTVDELNELRNEQMRSGSIAREEEGII